MELPALTRRDFARGLAAMLAPAAAVSFRASSARTQTRSADIGPYERDILPRGIRSRFVHDVNGIRMHVLEAGFEAGNRPAVLLLHGFPELGYSWRKVMPALASAGYHAIAPDMRGYGRTDGTDVAYDDDPRPFRLLNHVLDMVELVSALGYRAVDVVGHDFGSPVAAWSAVIRPDIFRSVVLMSAPFGGTPSIPFGTADSQPTGHAADTSRASIVEELAALKPPRKHYQWYYSTRAANEDMWHAPQGLHAFLRAYYHMKSGDWRPNEPFPLKGWTGAELAQLPRYYVMDQDKGMAETVAREMPSASEIAACEWLTEQELRLYSTEYGRTGFQGGLDEYRCATTGLNQDLRVFSGRTIDQPSLFIAGKSDWGVYQSPGTLERMQGDACTDMKGVHLVDGAGHWVQQEKPQDVNRILLEFLQRRA